MEEKKLQTVCSNTGLSEQSRKALESDTWQKAREAMGAAASERKADAAVRTETNEEFHYGDWKAALHEYLKTVYKSGKSMCDITSGGTVYQVMEKDDKVTFYDAAGNTLFDVGYEQLEKEYAVLMGQQEDGSEDCGDKRQEEDSGSIVKEQAKKKLKKELVKAKDQSFAKPVIEYLIERCGEDHGLSEDVIQEHKTWEKCYKYIYFQAQKSAQKGARSIAVRDDTVFEWAEDYYHKDDKAEEEEKARKEAIRKEEQKRKAERSRKAKAAVSEKKQDRPKEQPKPKKSSRDMEGQLDMFSMMGVQGGVNNG